MEDSRHQTQYSLSFSISVFEPNLLNVAVLVVLHCFGVSEEPDQNLSDGSLHLCECKGDFRQGWCVQNRCIRYNFREIILKCTAPEFLQLEKAFAADELVVQWIEDFKIVTVECQFDQ